jgi:hypothetical protein
MLRHTFADTGNRFNDRAARLLEGKDAKFLQVFLDWFYRLMQDKRNGAPGLKRSIDRLETKTAHLMWCADGTDALVACARDYKSKPTRSGLRDQA